MFGASGERGLVIDADEERSEALEEGRGEVPGAGATDGA